MAADTTVSNAVKLAGNLIMWPGTSQLLEGNVPAAGLHAILGLAAGAFLGAPGILLAAANSFAQSATNKNLYEHGREALASLTSSSRAQTTPS